MEKLSLLFLITLMASPCSFARDEENIPPPPMPEYMKKHQVKMKTQDTFLGAEEIQTVSSEEGYEDSEGGTRDTASTPEASFNDQSAESIKNEFLNAGDTDHDVAEDVAVQEVIEGSIDEASEQEIAEAPAEVYEDPVVREPIEEMSEVEVAAPEFEQADLEAEKNEKAKNDFQTDVGSTPVVDEPAAEAVPTQEVLAAVEENLEAAEQEAEANLETGRSVSGKKNFKAGMYQFSKKCTMYSEPKSLSSEAGSVPEGRKLWIDPHNDSWHKAYKKSGTVYIPSGCLQ